MTRIFEDIYVIDSKLFGIPNYTCAYLVVGQKTTLIETASASCASTILSGIREIGIKPDDISRVVLTHIHLDHAGGAGALSSMLRNARVLLHPRGVKHMANPFTLLESARQYIGDKALKIHGETRPIPAHKVQGLTDGEIIRISKDRNLVVMFAPGHASHQICLVDRESGVVFTGDAAGMRLDGMSTPMPTTGSPDFNLEKAIETVQRLRRLKPRALLFSHFGPVTERVDEILVNYGAELKEWERIIAAALKTGKLPGNMPEKIVGSLELDKIPLPKEILLRIVRMNILGYASYLGYLSRQASREPCKKYDGK